MSMRRRLICYLQVIFVHKNDAEPDLATELVRNLETIVVLVVAGVSQPFGR